MFISCVLRLSISPSLSPWLVVLVLFLSFSIIPSIRPSVLAPLPSCVSCTMCICLLFFVHPFVHLGIRVSGIRPYLVLMGMGRHLDATGSGARGRQSMLPPSLAVSRSNVPRKSVPLYPFIHLIICIVEQNHRSFSSIHVSPWSPWVSRSLTPSGTEVLGVYTVLVYIGALSMYADGEIVYVYLYAYIRLSCFGF